MIAVTTMAGREVALFGLGGSGMATARALREGGAEPVVWDDNPDRVNAARDEGLRAQDLRTLDWGHVAALVLAPGVPLTHPQPHWTVDLAAAAGVEVIGDIELFCRERAATCPNAPFVAVTGTNGKSTTTALIAHLLREEGLDVQMGGNIGVPILALEPLSEKRVYVVECSSYQIDLAPSLNPTVGVLLNVTPDHLDRHGSFENYVAIKERLVSRAWASVVGIDDDPCRAVAKRLAAEREGRPRSHLTFSHSDDEADVFVRDGRVWAHPPGRLEPPSPHDFVDLRTHPSLRGAHNAQNVAAAVAAMVNVRQRGSEFHARGLRSFRGLPHRMEHVPVEDDDVVFYNDSKATNAESVAPALSAFERVHWIAGGLPKDGGIEPLRRHFDRIERAYLIGDAAPQFAATLGETVPYEIAGTLDVAVKRAAHDARLARGGVVLFSPAAASFDQFRNFEDRGEAFKAAVRAVFEGD